MKIAKAEVGLTSAHTFRQEQSREESLRLWVGDERPAFAGEEEPAATQVQISPQAKLRQLTGAAQAGQLEKAADSCADPSGESLPEDPKLKALRLILEALTGRKIRVADFKPVSGPAPAPPAGGEANGVESPARQGWGLEYDLRESLVEEESLAFSAIGQVLTEDGERINFSLDLVMRREFAATSTLQIRAGDARLVDPLVINFAGRGAELAGTRFAFDLDGDGGAEQISGLAQGSGFLAFDRNGDGVINNGLELFGPATGQGFAELARFDSDGNGWLDENDPMYAQIKVWMRDEAGNDSLSSLAEKKVGAIMLNPVNSEFSLKNSENVLLARIRESSVFLKESGEAGTVQEIDLAV